MAIYSFILLFKALCFLFIASIIIVYTAFILNYNFHSSRQERVSGTIFILIYAWMVLQFIAAKVTVLSTNLGQKEEILKI